MLWHTHNILVRHGKYWHDRRISLGVYIGAAHHMHITTIRKSRIEINGYFPAGVYYQGGYYQCKHNVLRYVTHTFCKLAECLGSVHLQYPFGGIYSDRSFKAWGISFIIRHRMIYNGTLS